MNKKGRRQFGALEMKAIAYLQSRGTKTLCTGELKDVLGIADQTDKDLLSSLNKKGIITRLSAGYYLVPNKISPSLNAIIDGMEILFYLMNYYDAKYMISGPTAIYYYGYTTQISNRIYVYNDKIYGDRQIGGSSFVFMKTSPKRLKGAEFIVTSEGLKIPYVSKARLLIDCIYDWNRYNTIPKVFNWIKDEIEKDSETTAKLVSNAIRYGNKIVQRRLGYFLEILNIDEKLVEKLQNKIKSSKTLKPLIPNTDCKGSVNKKWGLIINGKI
ncbi:MAG: hypothetical protein HQ554_06800 [FCB group bacterium]|nr:hypothetical protein [FCB group bacterium]